MTLDTIDCQTMRFKGNSYVHINRIISIIILTAATSLLTLYYFIVHPYVSNVINITFTTATRSNFTNNSRSSLIDTLLSPSFIYLLDSECKSDLNDSASKGRQKEFNDIFETGRWNFVGSRSGPGSSLEGTYDWIRHLRSLFDHYPIRSVADIPCGDTYWQFSLREMNTIEGLYFGGDISVSVIKQNQRLYGAKHRNKLFQYWDLVHCPIPTYTYKNSTHEIRGNHFDLIIVRDAIQHMHIKNALKAVQNVIRSGATFFALTTFPPNEKSSAANTRSIRKNEPLPSMPTGCDTKNYCALGSIKEGDVYHNNINCPPFNFPLNKTILLQPSHEKFRMESDEIHIYKIDEELIKIVEQYDKACS